MTRRVRIRGDFWTAEMRVVNGRIVDCDRELEFMRQMSGVEVARVCRERGWRWVSEQARSAPFRKKKREPVEHIASGRYLTDPKVEWDSWKQTNRRP